MNLQKEKHGIHCNRFTEIYSDDVDEVIGGYIVVSQISVLNLIDKLNIIYHDLFCML